MPGRYDFIRRSRRINCAVVVVGQIVNMSQKKTFSAVLVLLLNLGAGVFIRLDQ